MCAWAVLVLLGLPEMYGGVCEGDRVSTEVVTIPEKETATDVRRSILTMLWKMYSKQKASEAESGVDVTEDMARMKDWFRSAMKGEASKKDMVELFGEAPKPSGCPKCGSDGWYFSESAYFERTGPKGAPIVIQGPGMRVCQCPAGGRKNQAIRDHGKSLIKKPYGGKREEF